jgi:transposase-like protein
MMTKAEADALLVLAPGAFVRVNVNCPYCRRELRAEPRVKGAVIDWSYECQKCGSVLERVNGFVRSPRWWKV